MNRGSPSPAGIALRQAQGERDDLDTTMDYSHKGAKAQGIVYYSE